MATKKLKDQKINAWIVIGVGILHTLAHFLLVQPREALLVMLRKGMFNVLGPDWAATNFSVSMSLALGFAIICLGVFILQMAKNDLRFPLPAAICLLAFFVFVVYVGPTGGGWLALPSCIYLLVKALPEKQQN